MVYQVEKMLKDHRDKISDDDAKNVEEALEATRKAIAGGSVEEINKAADTLTPGQPQTGGGDVQVVRPRAPGGGRRGGQRPGGDGAGAGAGAEKPKDNVVDAEFVDVEDKK